MIQCQNFMHNKKKNQNKLIMYEKQPLIRPSVSKVKARSGGQPAHSTVVVRGIVDDTVLEVRLF